MADAAVLELRAVEGFYGESQVLHGVDLTVQRGEIVTLIGRNGAGKTTTLRAVMGILRQRRGSVRVMGQETIGFLPEKIARLGVGYVPEERGIFASLNVIENLLLPPRLKPGGAPAGAGHPLSGLLYLAPVCVFGFLLCPYLDLTFHRARQRTSPRAGAVAFAVGFGGPFLLMIVFTFWYARLLAPLAAGQPATFLPERLRWAIAAHMAVQLGYTVGVHWAALGWRPPFTDAAKVGGGLFGFVAGLVPQALGLFADHLASTRLSRGELVYRAFLAFYGLVFPAYVWLCMVPTPDGSGLTRRKLRVFAAAVIAAGPMFWLGFIERKMIWLLPGLAVVLLARLLLLRSDSAKSSRASLPRAAGIDSRR